MLSTKLEDIARPCASPVILETEIRYDQGTRQDANQQEVPLAEYEAGP